MSQITTHVLDTALGVPAAGITISLQQSTGNNSWVTLGQGVTNKDGRISNLLATESILVPGNYRMHFELSAYFKASQQPIFYPEVNVIFQVSDETHYHIPLLLSPYGYSTYRGS